MTKVRESLLPIAQIVSARVSGIAGELTQAQIEGTIAANAREKFLSKEEEAALIQLRSQLFKSPRKTLTYKA